MEAIKRFGYLNVVFLTGLVGVTGWNAYKFWRYKTTLNYKMVEMHPDMNKEIEEHIKNGGTSKVQHKSV